MKLIFSENAWEDYLYWQKTDKKILNRINKLIKETKREPFEGVGKPEPLKHSLAGYWSRRINDEHQIEKVGAKLREMMPWISKGKMVDRARN